MDAPGPKNIFFWISLIYMEILVLKFEGPIFNNNGNKMFVPPPWDAPGQKIFFFNFFDLYGNFSIKVRTAYL